jgi:hypothetical protein
MTLIELVQKWGNCRYQEFEKYWGLVLLGLGVAVMGMSKRRSQDRADAGGRVRRKCD